jgi:DNA-directed RNA polymerase specialized sigma24 family protein
LTGIHTFTAPPEDRLFVDVLEPVTANVIRPVVRRTLHVSLREDDTSTENQDALELVGDVQVALLSALESSGTNGRAIENPDAYAATVATNACYQYLRNKFPVRAQQTNKLRYLLSHDDRFEVYRGSAGGWLCRLSKKATVGKRARSYANNERDRYARTVYDLLHGRKEPVLLDDLVGEVMTALGLREQIRYTGADENDDPYSRIADEALPAHGRLEAIERLRRLWQGIVEMPVRHRKALLLNLRDGDGGLIWALPVSGVADLNEIAAALEMPAHELAAIWNELPWDDLTIARHLGLQRQQVINLRQSARAGLLRRERAET